MSGRVVLTALRAAALLVDDLSDQIEVESAMAHVHRGEPAVDLRVPRVDLRRAVEVLDLTEVSTDGPMTTWSGASVTGVAVRLQATFVRWHVVWSDTGEVASIALERTAAQAAAEAMEKAMGRETRLDVAS